MVEEKRDMSLASLAGDGDEMGLMGILDLVGVFPGKDWPVPVCVDRTPSSVMGMSRAVD